MAKPNLSPKSAAERMQRFQSAVRTIALFKAKKTVHAQIRARGERISDYSCRQLSQLAEDYLAQHFNELVNKAAADVATWSEFAGCAELPSDAQMQKPQNSMASTVQMSDAK